MAKLKDLELGEAALKPYSWEHTNKDGTKRTLNVVIRILSGGELDIAKAQAVAYVSSLRKEQRPEVGKQLDIDKAVDDELVETARHYECLSIAVRDPDNPKDPWASAHELRRKLSNDEVIGIWKVYEEHQADIGPIVYNLPLAAIEALINKLVEDPANNPLRLFAYGAQMHFTRIMAAQLVSARTDNALLSLQVSGLLNALNQMRKQAGLPPINDVDELDAEPDGDELTTEPAA